jgi:uncharacterized membrane protein YhaH (DUF805 family)
MESFAPHFSASGRIAPKPFALGVLIVYVASFLSQVLISPPLSGRGGLYVFAIVQIALVWMWYTLHAKRLNDAGRAAGSALAIAVLYALAIVLLVLLVEPLLAPDTNAAVAPAPRSSFVGLWVFLLIIVVLSGWSDFGIFYIFAVGTLVLILAPIAIAVGFSIWTGTRPSVARAPATAVPAP